MHLATVVFSIFAAWRWGDWKNWEKYHTTMLYVAVCNLLYNFIYSKHLLWQLKPYLLYSHNVAELFYSFIVFPLSALILLSNYPSSFKGQILRIVQFVAVYTFMEWLFYLSDKIFYSSGWSIWWSLGWNFIMFPMWMLHHKKPLIAYAASVIFVMIVLKLFPVPLKP
ncbi:MAG: hypothetical protein N2484_10555 [Clostridia bacterium]|nr:hypothetical protein [Clostridia bacterium]